MATRVIKSREPGQHLSAAAEGARVLRAGGLVGFATETVYGVAAVATSTAAMERLRELKNRPARPFSVHIGRPADVARYVRHVPQGAKRLVEKAWPGPITLLLPVSETLADASLPAEMMGRLVYEGAIGLRCPDEPVAIAMLSAVADPVVAPSANLAGAASPRTADDVLGGLDGKIDLLIDSGPTRYGVDSTIVQFAGPGGCDWKVLRQGVYDQGAIERMVRRLILFVCTGNTCRSPMAAGLARELLAAGAGVPAGRLAGCGIEVASAGLAAADGAKATPEAIAAAGAMGADIAAHRSRKLTSELIQAADLVLCMTDFHVAEVQRLWPAAAGKVQRLSPHADVPDPIGAGPNVYGQTAEAIRQALLRRIDEGTL
jgi:protein-tyrosine phosphatase